MSSQTASIQNVELTEEIEAINAIYEPDTITVNSGAPSTTSLSTLNIAGNGPSSTSTRAITVKLIIPNYPYLSFLVEFHESYPATPPRVVGTASTASRGEGKIAVDVLEDIVQRTFQPGAVCMFEVINEAIEAFEELHIGGGGATSGHGDGKAIEDSRSNPREEAAAPSSNAQDTPSDDVAKLSLKEPFDVNTPPDWILSDVVTEKKSVFVARAAHVTRLEQAQAFLDHLLETEKKVAAATHNISAWRIRQKKVVVGKNGESSTASTTETIIQDCDDDGETAAGGRLLHLMQLMDVWNVIVVVTRWYGGVHLGPDRFRIINAVGRDALLKGGFGRDDSSNGHDKTKKKGKK